MMDRRGFLATAAALPASVASALPLRPARPPVSPRSGSTERFGLSLSQWSYHRSIFGDSRADYDRFLHLLATDPDAVLQGDMDPRDIVVRARELDLGTVDLVNVLFYGHAADGPWLAEFGRRARREGVGFGILMIDEAGSIGASDAAARAAAIARHRQWLDCAVTLGCTAIRVNAYGDGTYLAQLRQCAESLAVLGDLGAEAGLDVLVENHGHPSSNGAWLAMLMEATAHPRVGVLADFDNFFMGGWNHDPQRRYDSVQGMLDLAPYTRAVSAKSYDFGADGLETRVDFHRAMQIVLDAGFDGLASAEYEGEHLSEAGGTRATVALLRTVRQDLGLR